MKTRSGREKSRPGKAKREKPRSGKAKRNLNRSFKNVTLRSRQSTQYVKTEFSKASKIDIIMEVTVFPFYLIYWNKKIKIEFMTHSI
jgi:hypothetical protein